MRQFIRPLRTDGAKQWHGCQDYLASSDSGTNSGHNPALASTQYSTNPTTKDHSTDGRSRFFSPSGTPGSLSRMPTRKPTAQAMYPAQLMPSRGPDHLYPART